MNFIKKLFDKQELQDSLSELRERFPTAVGISCVVTILFFYLISDAHFLGNENLIGKYILTAIVVFFLSISSTILSESLQLNCSKSYLSQIGVFLFGIIFFYFFPENIDDFQSVVFFTLTIVGIISSLFIAPYVQYLPNRNFKQQAYYLYFYNISVVFFLSCIVGGALTILGNVAIFTVTTLFDIGYASGGDIHGYWSVFALSFLTPMFALTQLPKKGSFENTDFSENAFFHFLIRYIALPFIYVYFVILYAYTLKVLANFESWPKGEVSWMVIGFSSFGYLIYIFSYIYQQKHTHKFTHIFRKFFPYIVIPQLGMLFYAIALRIGQYDFTINRYFVVVFGIWLLICSLYFIISKVKSLIMLPALLTLFTLIISIGPWSVYNFPLYRQTLRLENNLMAAGILKNDEIRPLENSDNINEVLSGKIYGGIEYICNYNDCENIKDLFSVQYQNLLDQRKADFENGEGYYNYKLNVDYEVSYSDPSSWEIIDYITSTIKVKRYNSYNDPDQGKIISLYNQAGIYPMDISGYDYAIQANAYNSQTHNNKVSINQDTLTMKIEIGDVQEEISLDNIANFIRENYSTGSNNSFEDQENIFTFDGEIFEGKFIIEGVNIYSKADYVPKNQYMQQNITGLILLRTK